MKSVYRYHGLGEALLHDGMHTVYFVIKILKNFHKSSVKQNIL